MAHFPDGGGLPDGGDGRVDGGGAGAGDGDGGDVDVLSPVSRVHSAPPACNADTDTSVEDRFLPRLGSGPHEASMVVFEADIPLSWMLGNGTHCCSTECRYVLGVHGTDKPVSYVPSDFDAFHFVKPECLQSVGEFKMSSIIPKHDWDILEQHLTNGYRAKHAPCVNGFLFCLFLPVLYVFHSERMDYRSRRWAQDEANKFYFLPRRMYLHSRERMDNEEYRVWELHMNLSAAQVEQWRAHILNEPSPCCRDSDGITVCYDCSQYARSWEDIRAPILEKANFEWRV